MISYTFENVTIEGQGGTFDLSSLTVAIGERNGLKSGSGVFNFPNMTVSGTGDFEVTTESAKSFKILVKRLNYRSKKAEFVTNGFVPLDQFA